MKYKLLSIEKKPICNIGDYVQALAASQFLPRVDGFINREELSEYEGDECKVIMNGWYMHNPDKWPPSNNIHPLFVAFHLNTSVSEKMLTPAGVGYLKNHEPIGCRDNNTVSLLQQKDINAYFSGCLTLTLGRKYKSNTKTDKIYFVDPIIPEGALIKDLLSLFSNPISSYRLTKKLFPRLPKYRTALLVARFIRCYSKIFEKKCIVQAEYINHQNAFYASLSNDDRLIEAERLVKLYSRAAFVVTSRIHCALPCLGLETPVYFIQKEVDDEISSCRFAGLIDLFNRITISDNGLTSHFALKSKISKKNIIMNKDSWKVLADALTARCEEFTPSN